MSWKMYITFTSDHVSLVIFINILALSETCNYSKLVQKCTLRTFEFHTVCVCRNAFKTDFLRKVTFKSNFRESVNFQKMLQLPDFQKNVPWTLA